MIRLTQVAAKSAAMASLAVAALAAVPAVAVTYTTTLSSLNQVPPQESSASGTGLLTLATDMNSFTILMKFTSLSSALTGAHVHCCVNARGNAPIAVEFTLPANVPTTGLISGVISGTYDLTQASTYTPDFLAAYGGTAAGARAGLINGLNNGLAYLNIHSLAYPDGEIRGQLAAGAVGGVPEPTSWALMLTGFALVGGTVRRRATRAAAV